MKYSSCLSKLHSEPMKYRAICLWLCLIWKGVLFLALVEKQATNIKCKFVSLSIYRSMYEPVYTDVCKLTSGPSITELFRGEWFEWADSGWVLGLERKWAGLKASCDEKPMLKSINALILLGCSCVKHAAGQTETKENKSCTLKSFKYEIMRKERSKWNHNATFF